MTNGLIEKLADESRWKMADEFREKSADES